MHKFHIHAPLNSNDSFIEIDGKRMEGVTRIEFAVATKSLAEITLTVMGYIDITGEFREEEILQVCRKKGIAEKAR